jgi:hypothetical protein
VVARDNTDADGAAGELTGNELLSTVYLLVMARLTHRHRPFGPWS